MKLVVFVCWGLDKDESDCLVGGDVKWVME